MAGASPLAPLPACPSASPPLATDPPCVSAGSSNPPPATPDPVPAPSDPSPSTYAKAPRGAPGAGSPFIFSGFGNLTVGQNLLATGAQIASGSGLQVSLASGLASATTWLNGKVPVFGTQPLTSVEWGLSGGVLFFSQYYGANALNNYALTVGTVTSETPPANQASVAVAPLNLSQQTEQAAFRSMANQGTMTYQLGQVQLIGAFSGLARAGLATASHDPQANINAYLAQQPALNSKLSRAQVMVPMALAAFVNPTTWQAGYAQGAALGLKLPAINSWKIPVGSFSLAWPNVETFYAPTEPVIGARTLLVKQNFPVTVEAATQVGTISGRVRQEVDVSNIPLTFWLSMSPYGAIDAGGGQKVGGVLGVVFYVQPWANDSSIMSRVTFNFGIDASGGDLVRQGVQGVPNSNLGLPFYLGPKLGININIDPASSH